MHNLRHDNLDVHQIIIFGFGLGAREVGEISLWRNVDYFHAEEELLGSFLHESGDKKVEPEAYAQSPLVLLNAMEILLRKYPVVLFVRNNFAFHEDTIHDMLHMMETEQLLLASLGEYDPKTRYYELPLLGFKAGSDAAKIYVGFELQCRRGFQCDPVMRRSLTAAQRKMTANHIQTIDTYKMGVTHDGSNFYCYLLLRDDALYQFDSMEERDSNLVRNKHHEGTDSKITIALGMPTLSVDSLGSFEEVAPIRLFLPSLLKTVQEEEWARFRYVLYIGYDLGDRFFDNEQERAKILQKMKDMVHGKDISFELIRFPYSKGWVTYLWNALYVHAMKDGCDYFFQVKCWWARRSLMLFLPSPLTLTLITFRFAAER